ncbi:beta-N-acetylhexosaminidase [Sporosarcina sp. OR05]|uniref:beta-N-acetylhexosaminidase n=1 Tax=Sporosarcina sp. OR05 TaxID=2969819 RepID=UPI003529E11A
MTERQWNPNMCIRLGYVLACLFLLLTACSQPSTMQDEQTIPTFSEREQVAPIADMPVSYIDEQLEKMSLDEKIGQLIIVGMKGKTYDDELDHLIRHYRVGGIIVLGKNVSTPTGIVQLLNEAKVANKDYSIPLFLSVDEEGGRVSRLPAGMKKLPAAASIGQKEDEALAYKSGVYLAELLHAFGYNINFAPVLDVNSNPKNPVIGDRSYSSNPQIVTQHALSVRKGMVDNGVISIVKHFPGHGDTHIDSHKSLPVIDKNIDELIATELVPFQQAIAQEVDGIMIAHILFPALDATNPSSLSKNVITDFLREELGYDGVVITDDLTMGAITNAYTVPEAGLQAFIAGSDLLLIAGDYANQVKTIETLKDAVFTGTISEERIDESVRRILELKHRYNLEDDIVGQIDVNALNKQAKEALR